MNENNEKVSDQHLTAKELLSTRGICSRLIDEYNEVSKVLPKTGVKLFEPNGSWLQNKQIDTCLNTRKDLIKVERVNRLSALATAEWLPNEKKAKVIKRSGIEWNNYGNDIRGALYLIPEEALLLLEMNCIELLYNNLPLSIQQAYELLLNLPNSDCTLSEYRVFSQLARLGYRLQRFQYEKSINGRHEENVQFKKKVIVDPDNGGWMGNTCSTSSSTNSNSEDNSEEIQKEVKEIVSNIVDKVEVQAKIRTKPRVEIVSEETIVDPVKLVVSSIRDLSGTSDNKMIKLTGARIQRNVKLLPKRLDKKISGSSLDSLSSTLEKSSSVSSNNCTLVEKRKTETISSLSCKKSKQEIIELSDDEIEEIPRTMTRMEMLNCIPNIASKNCITQVVSRGYIPHSIKPQRSIYEYDSARILRIRGDNKNTHVSKTVASTSGQNNSNDHLSLRHTLLPHRNFSNPLISPLTQNIMARYNHQHERILPHGHRNFPHTSRFSHNAPRFQNAMINPYQNNYVPRAWSSFQSNVFQNIAMMGFAFRPATMLNPINPHQAMWNTQDFSRHNPRMNTPHQNSSRHSSNMEIDEWEESKNESTKSNENKLFQASFVKMSADSWSELKKKWKESKTITIEDEDDKSDCSEVQIVQHDIQPLVNSKNVRNMSEVFARLSIIKSAPPKTVRRKVGEYKISYKVYSNTQHYKKSDPGTPMFHLVIVSRPKNFLQPIELNRLQQEGDNVNILFAYVTNASISFIQAGLVSLPNLSNE